ncbi:hypothetical protein GS11_2880 [Mycobacterium tuberculosis variant bovis BCG]|nr:hypothetical protein GS11_2880 [Mycobacterium tuberculosis variant bovis BCG]AOZ44044.1 hypothetical protein BTB1458_3047 [Mycobacterium tuberculosis]EQM21269.1 hypothetical protein FJ05194_1766 [Mycobacterium tuberculosis FJ05194]BAQ06881.1 hypothetical protein KURONO_3098 [Mycobacterium tuberculosis str. Kurono]ALA79305.1 Uncharacterized protein BCGR_2988 [Mycobacterium tuberculosis variant bovis BCG]
MDGKPCGSGKSLSCSEDMIFLRRRGDLERYLLSGHSG